MYLVKKFIENKYKSRIIACKTVRDNNKLALSSRNSLLKKHYLKIAGKIAKNLFSYKNDLEMRDNIYVNLKNELISIFKWSKNLNDRNQLYYICDECIIIN